MLKPVGVAVLFAARRRAERLQPSWSDGLQPAWHHARGLDRIELAVSRAD